MRVGINALSLGSRGGGIEVYVRNIARALVTVDPARDYTLFVASRLPAGLIPSVERMRQVVVPSYQLFGRIPIGTSMAILRQCLDVLHVQLVLPPVSLIPVVVTVHDIAFEHYPQYFPPEMATRLRRSMPRTLRRSAIVVTDSHFSKQDIVQHYPISSEKVVVAHLAPDSVYRPLYEEARLAQVRARYGTGERFILYVGNLDPRKNLKTLIAAYTRLRQADAVRHKLVLVGHTLGIGQSDETFAAARASGYMDELVFAGYVPDDDLVALYNAADLFVFPSLFEGFGLPPLEAMACGTPVITSNTSSLPEVVGEAAPMVDPRDVEGLAAAMAEVLRDPERQAQLRTQGLERARQFSWDATARILHEVYTRAARAE